MTDVFLCVRYESFELLNLDVQYKIDILVPFVNEGSRFRPLSNFVANEQLARNGIHLSSAI